MRWTPLLFGAILVHLGRASIASDRSVRDPSLPTEAAWQTGSACGPNALYCLLRAKGRPVEYRELLVYLSPPQEGNSLEELRRASQHWGLPLTVYRTTRKGFNDLKPPFIAHTEEQGLRHYLLVTGSSAAGVEVFDPENAAKSTLPIDVFFRMWTGYALGNGTRWADRILWLVVALEFAGVLVMLVLVVWRLRAARSSAIPNPPGPTRPNGLRPAFTLIELLVVIGIVGVLTALVLVGVQGARESARRAQCVNNLKQIGIALQGYHSAMNVLPMGYATRLDPLGASEVNGDWGWGAMVLPQMDRTPLFNDINFSWRFVRPEAHTVRQTSISTYLCPSSDDFGPVVIHLWPFPNDPYLDDLAAANYVASAGTRSLGHSPFSMDGTIMSRTSEGDGTMYCNSAVSLSAVMDGASSTFLCGERSRNLADAAWSGSVTLGPPAYICTRRWTSRRECIMSPVLMLGHTGPENGGGFAIWVDRPNYPASGADGFWSRHPGGCNFLYCDGSVRFVRDSIDPRTFHALGTRAGGEAVVAE